MPEVVLIQHHILHIVICSCFGEVEDLLSAFTWLVCRLYIHSLVIGVGIVPPSCSSPTVWGVFSPDSEYRRFFKR